MYLKKTLSLTSVMIASLILTTNSQASLDLLAGVEAGIESNTAMSASDLEQTQRILSTSRLNVPNEWENKTTGTRYNILIEHGYSFGSYPCLTYQLTIDANNQQETKSLNACKNDQGQWISITAGSSAL